MNLTKTLMFAIALGGAGLAFTATPAQAEHNACEPLQQDCSAVSPHCYLEPPSIDGGEVRCYVEPVDRWCGFIRPTTWSISVGCFDG